MIRALTVLRRPDTTIPVRSLEKTGYLSFRVIHIYAGLFHRVRL